MLEEIKQRLADNYRNDDEVIKGLIDETTAVALSISNQSDVKKLQPYIEKCVIGKYLNSGGEGLSSLSDSGKSSSFKNIEEEMRNNIIKDGMRRIY